MVIHYLKLKTVFVCMNRCETLKIGKLVISQKAQSYFGKNPVMESGFTNLLQHPILCQTK